MTPTRSLNKTPKILVFRTSDPDFRETFETEDLTKVINELSDLYRCQMTVMKSGDRWIINIFDDYTA